MLQEHSSQHRSLQNVLFTDGLLIKSDQQSMECMINLFIALTEVKFIMLLGGGGG
jgi:hypothetical protein